MATMHFDWSALAGETPENQYEMVTQIVRMLPEDMQEKFMQTDGFHDWLHSPEMDVIFKTFRAGDDQS